MMRRASREKAVAICSVVVGFACVHAGASAANRPSFSCEKAATDVEKAICADTSLATLDRAIDKAFRDALARDPLGRPYLLDEQREWLKSRNLQCDEAPRQTCLAAMFKTRLATIQSHDPRDTPMCRAIANTISEAGGYMGTKELFLPPAMNGDPQSSVHFDLSDKPLSPSLLSKLPKQTITGDEVETENASVSHFGANQSVFAVTSVQGSMGCEYISLFKIVAGGQIESIHAPPGSDTGCPTSVYFGAIGDRSQPERAVLLYVGASNSEDASSMQIWSRRDDRWHHACTVEARYETQLTVSKTFCGSGATCQDLMKTALDAAKARESIKGGATRRLEEATLIPDAVSQEQVSLPVFGQEPDGAFMNFESAAPVYGFKGPRGAMALRISHGTVGWRTDENWLVAIYDRDELQLKPVASFMIAKSRSRFRDVVLK